MAPIDTALLTLALPSAAALFLVLVYLAANPADRAQAPRRRLAVAFLAAVSVYGILRHLAIQFISDRHLESPFPYALRRPMLSVGGISLQELMGWALASGLAWILADRLLARVRLDPGPHRVAAVAAAILAAICLAVENAAIHSGWWSWTLPLPPAGSAIRVPAVALLDWGFVSFDFLLPFLLFASAAAAWQRLVGLTLFPLHMLAHTLLQPLPEPVPLAGNDLLHAAIVAYVLALAIGESSTSSLAPLASERRRALPLLAAGIVAGVSAVAAGAAAGWAATISSLPLLGITGAAATRPRDLSTPAARIARPSSRALPIVVAALVLGAAAWIRVPVSRRQTAFVRHLESGVAALNGGDAVSAERELRAAATIRPDQPAARTLLALAHFRQGDRAAARSELEAVVDAQPPPRDALIMLASLELTENRRDEAARRAAEGRRHYPARPEFVYQAAVADGTAGPGRPLAGAAIALARSGGRETLTALLAMADALGDRATADECRAALAAQ